MLISAEPKLELFAPPQTGVVVWRPADGKEAQALFAAMPTGSVSMTTIGGERWLRNVAANPTVDLGAIAHAISDGVQRL